MFSNRASARSSLARRSCVIVGAFFNICGPARTVDSLCCVDLDNWRAGLF